MMASKNPIRFKRMAEALFEQSGGGGSSSSGSDHLPSGSLSDLVNSFIQKFDDENHHQEDGDGDGQELDDSDNSSGGDDERKELLKKLLGHGDDEGEGGFRRNVIEAIEVGFLHQFTHISSKDVGFKRRLMVYLRERGYDAGLCKSRWEKTGRYPAGNYDYVDMVTESGRYIVEVFPAGLFEVARPTDRYTELLEEFPGIFIGKPQTVKQMVRLMSRAMKESLKSSALQVAPWRKNGYLQAQWFGPYKRTTNANAINDVGLDSMTEAKRRTVVGFVDLAAGQKEEGSLVYDCRRELSSKSGIRIGLLAAALRGK